MKLKISVAKILKLNLTGAMALGLLSGCGSDPSGSNPNPAQVMQKLRGVEYGILEQGTLKTTESQIAGTGKLMFRQPAPDKDANFTLSFSIPEKGTLSFVGNADTGLKNGVTVSFSRTATNKLKIVTNVGSENYDFASDYAKELNLVAADQPLSVQLDLHEHGDLIVEVGGQKLGTEFTTKPSGKKLWGLVLQDATVTEAKADKAKYPH